MNGGESEKKRDWRFVRLEKEFSPKAESSLCPKPLEMKNEEKTTTIIKKKEQNKNETNHKQ